MSLVVPFANLPIEKMTKLEIRNKILETEQYMLSSVSNGSLVDENPGYPVRHIFTEGVYARELTIPAGQIVIGKIHRHEHLNFISKGKVTVITEEGGREELTAPCTLVSPAGVKRLLYTHEDTVWTVVHVTKETDLDKIEAQVIARSYEELNLEDTLFLGEN